MIRYLTVPLLLALSTTASLLSQSPIAISQEEASSTRTLTHESHPHHSLIITPHNALSASTSSSDRPDITTVCPGATSGYTGYLVSGSKHFYFAYFESRSNPADAPLVLWLNGGPGCSSMMGLFMELGPCIVNEDGMSARENPNSWINHASVFFLDQPIGVGFSYDSNGSSHAGEGGTFAASEDIYAFMQLWYHAFPNSRTLPFSIAGESYGGHYIPIFASHIHSMNAISPLPSQIPLSSIIIGNGIFSDVIQGSSNYDIVCTNATGLGPLLSAEACKNMSASVPRCEYLLQACSEYPDPLICNVAREYCDEKINEPYFLTGRNFYDVSKPCDGYLCYPIISSITRFLHNSTVRSALGVDPLAPAFQGCSSRVGREFEKVNDWIVDTRPYVSELLDAGIRALIYVGTYDWICNFVGNERVWGGLEWEGKPDFRYQQENNRRSWEGGLWWESEGGALRYVRVDGAGHMVPWDKPVLAEKMFRAWVKKEPLT